ncbi:MAG TPA: hypothetical protein VKV40_04185 [Ktedonobacteraceae bacterium]|nr:hypothetical protein [Ktedonobacteraceae bacterium]
MVRLPVLHTRWFVFGSVLLVFGLNVLLDLFTHSFLGDLPGLLYFAAFGFYCLQNFVGCREYHCMITGPGFTLAALVMLLRIIGIFDHGFGLPYLIGALASLIGFTLEWRYWKRTGSHFIQTTSSSR